MWPTCLIIISARGDDGPKLKQQTKKKKLMANEASSSTSTLWEEAFVGADSGWVEARTRCDHLSALCSDLSQIPTPDSPCTRCQHPTENWLCLSCKDVLCSRFVNQHMLKHFQETEHCLALSFSDLSVWCFCCDAYLDAQMILQLRPVYEVAHLLKFGERPPFRTIESLQLCDNQVEDSSSSS